MWLYSIFKFSNSAIDVYILPKQLLVIITIFYIMLERAVFVCIIGVSQVIEVIFSVLVMFQGVIMSFLIPYKAMM
jgi:hypothetical protein